MPRRPRSHQLEEESRRKFQDSIPSVWVTRTVDQDYGIDVQVEVFEEDGSATGMLFLVQLKSTDSEDIKKALSIPLRIDTYEYFHKLELPTMIVSFHKSTDTLFWRWIHEFDPQKVTGTKTFSFPIEADHAWDPRTPERIKTELKTFQQLKPHRLELPVRCELVVIKPVVSPTLDIVIESALRKRLNEVSWLIHFDEDFGNADHPTLTVSSKKLSVNLAGTRSVTLDLPAPYNPDEVVKCLPNDLLCAIAILFARMNRADIASRILAESLDSSGLRRNPEFFTSCIRVFIKAARIGDALGLAKKFIERSEKQLAEMLLITPLLSSKTLNSADEQFLIDCSGYSLTRQIATAIV